MTTLIIVNYNRYEYLLRCISSVIDMRVLPENIIIIDDCSSDSRCIDLINDFFVSGVNIKLMFNDTNIGIKGCLLKAYDYAFNVLGSNFAINIDNDTLVREDFLERLIGLKMRFLGNVVSGFNSLNKDNYGNLRNPIISEGSDYYEKRHFNGINICISKSDYDNGLRDILANDSISNWDYEYSNLVGGGIISKPSLVQHIGFESSMGHFEGADVACDFALKILELPSVTLFGVDAHNPSGLLRASEICQRNIKFGKVEMITERLFWGREGYSRFCFEDMYKYIHTSHVLIIHPDGYVQNADAWDNEWLQYDYIGATWWYKDNKNVGNGGFSLRSRRLLKILAQLDIKDMHPEDDVICRQIRGWLESEYDIKFAPEEVANRFSIEAYGVQYPYNAYNGQFGFHGHNVINLNIPL